MRSRFRNKFRKGTEIKKSFWNITIITNQNFKKRIIQ